MRFRLLHGLFRGNDNAKKSEEGYLGSIRPTVRNFLKTEHETRNNDNLLIARVIESYSESNLSTMSAQELVDAVKRNEFPSFESIRRTRQQLQEKEPELRGKAWSARQRKAEAVRKEIRGS